MSIIRSTIFEIGDTVDAMNRGEALYENVHRLNELRGQLKWLLSNDFPLRPQSLDGQDLTVTSLLHRLQCLPQTEQVGLVNRFIYGCIADALNRGPSQAGTESAAAEKESASTTQESVTPPSDLRDQFALAAFPSCVENALKIEHGHVKGLTESLLKTAPGLAYQLADLALKARNDCKTDK